MVWFVEVALPSGSWIHALPRSFGWVSRAWLECFFERRRKGADIEKPNVDPTFEKASSQTGGIEQILHWRPCQCSMSQKVCLEPFLLVFSKPIRSRHLGFDWCGGLDWAAIIIFGVHFEKLCLYMFYISPGVQLGFIFKTKVYENHSLYILGQMHWCDIN